MKRSQAIIIGVWIIFGIALILAGLVELIEGMS